MSFPEIVAHRGAPDPPLENTLDAFLRAVALGADAVELDVRLTADRVPVVYHYFYLEQCYPLTGAIFKYHWEELHRSCPGIPSLEEVLLRLDGQIGLEIELKGPEPEAADIVAYTVQTCLTGAQRIEVTSYEPAMLQRFHAICPHIPADLLIPLSEPWMKADVLAYSAFQRARLAGARAVHLHASQLDRFTVEAICGEGIAVHAWGINDPQALMAVFTLGIPRLCTDNLLQAIEYRNTHTYESIPV
jgi:glycerophosphoryl diester phosphodiesterase